MLAAHTYTSPHRCRPLGNDVHDAVRAAAGRVVHGKG